MIHYTKPEVELSAYTCPYCSVFSKFNRSSFLLNNNYVALDDDKHIVTSDYPEGISSLCDNCKKIIIWINSEMIYPKLPNIYKPNEDLNENIKTLFNEATQIYTYSPRAACALLRLCLEKLCIQLGCDESKKINDNIKILIDRERLPKTIQQMLDYVRVIGNSAVHPNVIQESDKIETAQTLFDIINMLAYQLITIPREMDEKYIKHIPESIRNAIEKRK